MDKKSYIEDKNLLAYAYKTNDYSYINNIILEQKYDYIFGDDSYNIGYKIIEIDILSKLYGFKLYAVNFIYKNLSNKFDNNVDKDIKKMLNHLIDKLNDLNGYIIFKVPSSNMMIINQLNQLNLKFIFAGATICYLNYNDKIKSSNITNNLKIKIASKEDKIALKKEIVKLGTDSFENYFGQYHISYLTRDKADKVYENWINDAINIELNSNLQIGFSDEKLVAFNVIEESEKTIETILSGVSKLYRRQHIYESMISDLMLRAVEKNKIFTISTQLDNLVVQRTWVKLGLVPYHSFYLYHLDNRKGSEFNGNCYKK